MTTAERKAISICTTVNAPVERVWKLWTKPTHIVNWNNASPDWHTPRAENDLREGGKFLSRMEAKDGSIGFDFSGVYTRVEQHKEIAYRMEDDRTVRTTFTSNGNSTEIETVFDAEDQHSEEMQREGWQAILNNFKQYAESGGKLERLYFSVAINASVRKVYQTMLDQEGYRQWTAEFNPSSFYKGSWEQGSVMQFVGESRDGKVEGMVSRIKENRTNEVIAIEHIGMVDGENEITSGPAVDGWAGAMEIYRFREEGGKTVVDVEMDATQEHRSYFEQTWPKALQKLKEICE